MKAQKRECRTVKKQNWLEEVYKGGEGSHWTVVSSKKKKKQKKEKEDDDDVGWKQDNDVHLRQT